MSQPTSNVPKSVQQLRDGEVAGMALMPQAASQQLKTVTESPSMGIMDPVYFEHLWRVGTAFAKSQLVPKHFQGKPEDCFIAVQTAIELKCSPLMVLQNLFVVHGTPGFSSKFAIALANVRGPFKGVIQFETVGEVGKDSYGVTAYAVIKETGQRVSKTITMAIAKGEGWDKNTKYRSMGEQMLSYRAAMFLIRLYCPEVLFGMQSVEELEDTNGRGTDSYIVGEVVQDITNDYKPQVEQAQVEEKKPARTRKTAPAVTETPAATVTVASDPVVTEKPALTAIEVRGMIDLADNTMADDLDMCMDALRHLTPASQDELVNRILARFGAEMMSSCGYEVPGAPVQQTGME